MSSFSYKDSLKTTMSRYEAFGVNKQYRIKQILDSN